MLRILESIQILSVSIVPRKEDRDKEDKKLRWQLLNKLFLPLPQWRRQETAQLYCEKVYNIHVSILLRVHPIVPQGQGTAEPELCSKWSNPGH